jgi:3-phosphoshikimate 1-carboxyvinyltransferase
MTHTAGSSSVTVERSGPIDAVVGIPPSKSLTVRALAVAGLARGVSTIANPLAAGDTEIMARALGDLGIKVERGGRPWTVHGCAGRIPSSGARLDLGNAGTAMRFLTPIVATGRGTFVLDGSERMRRRPIADLLAALSALGMKVRSLQGNGCPPVEIRAEGLRGGEVTIGGGVSSQFLSGLLMAAPCSSGDLTIRMSGPLVSRPYVELTLDVMRRFGAVVETTDNTDRVHEDPKGRQRGHADVAALAVPKSSREAGHVYRVRGERGYTAADYTVEGDASSACWWFAAAAITGGRARVQGIRRDSRQGDLGFLDLLQAMGCRVAWMDPASSGHAQAGPEPIDSVEVTGGSLRGIEADLRDMPDAAPALAAVALFASSPTRITGAAHLRDKESDRIAGLALGLGSLGALVEEHRDGLTIRPRPLRAATLDPLDDHRLAMAFAVAALGIGGVTILNASCVSKSYPGFFETLGSVAKPAR